MRTALVSIVAGGLFYTLLLTVSGILISYTTPKGGLTKSGKVSARTERLFSKCSSLSLLLAFGLIINLWGTI